MSVGVSELHGVSTVALGVRRPTLENVLRERGHSPVPQGTNQMQDQTWNLTSSKSASAGISAVVTAEAPLIVRVQFRKSDLRHEINHTLHGLDATMLTVLEHEGGLTQRHRVLIAKSASLSA